MEALELELVGEMAREWAEVLALVWGVELVEALVLEWETGSVEGLALVWVEALVEVLVLWVWSQMGLLQVLALV